MSKLFELYVLGQLIDAYPGDIKFQFLSVSGIPDYLLKKKGAEMIIDAKYKEGFQPESLHISSYLLKDIRQVSGYSRDKKILKYLGYDIEYTGAPMCLIIYPDQNADENLMKNNIMDIPEFQNFKRRPVKLPEIK